MATQNEVDQKVFRWERRNLTEIATTAVALFKFFSEDLGINSLQTGLGALQRE